MPRSCPVEIVVMECPAHWSTPNAVWSFGCDGYVVKYQAVVPKLIADKDDEDIEYWLENNGERYTETKSAAMSEFDDYCEW